MYFLTLYGAAVSEYAAGCMCSVLFIEDILKCVVKHISTDLCFKTSCTLVMASVQKQHN